jgi:hypothetical protein
LDRKTCIFKQFSSVCDSSRAWVSFGGNSLRFATAFDEKEDFLATVPKASSPCPGFMVKARHELRCETAGPDEFWSLLDPAMLSLKKFDSERILECMKVIVKTKIVAAMQQQQQVLEVQSILVKVTAPDVRGKVRFLDTSITDQLDALHRILALGTYSLEEVEAADKMVRDPSYDIAHVLTKHTHGIALLAKAAAYLVEHTQQTTAVRQVLDQIGEFVAIPVCELGSNDGHADLFSKILSTLKAYGSLISDSLAESKGSFFEYLRGFFSSSGASIIQFSALAKATATTSTSRILKFLDLFNAAGLDCNSLHWVAQLPVVTAFLRDFRGLAKAAKDANVTLDEAVYVPWSMHVGSQRNFSW